MALADFKKVEAAAAELAKVSQGAAFLNAHKSREYEIQAQLFRRSAETVSRKARDKNLDGVTLAYVEHDPDLREVPPAHPRRQGGRPAASPAFRRVDGGEVAHSHLGGFPAGRPAGGAGPTIDADPTRRPVRPPTTRCLPPWSGPPP